MPATGQVNIVRIAIPRISEAWVAFFNRMMAIIFTIGIMIVKLKRTPKNAKTIIANVFFFIIQASPFYIISELALYHYIQRPIDHYQLSIVQKSGLE